MRILVLFVAAALVANQARAADRRNILMIAIDDMRPQLGCYGDKLVHSPNMDKLAARGLVFERAYCQQALCSPSRISLLSGRYPVTTRIFDIGPPLRSTMPDVTTLPQHFKNQGYFTKSIGKVYHVGIDDEVSWSVPSVQGKKPRYGPVGDALVKAKMQAQRKAGITKPEKPDIPHYAGPAFEAPEVGDEDLLDGDAARLGIEALREVAGKPGQPFFLAVGFANPHVPWVSPKKYWDLYDEKSLPLPDNQFLPHDAPAIGAQSGEDFYWYANVPRDRQLSEEFKRQCLHGYLAAISYVDTQVGRVLKALEETGLAKNTIVILWSDHGYYMGEHSWWGAKHNNYEGATRATLMCAVPGQKTAGRHTRALVEFVDIAPTLTELCGLPAETGFEGRSFAPLLENPDQPWKETAFSYYPKSHQQTHAMGTAMRTDRHRYVEWVNAEGKAVARELYDEKADPAENENIAEKPENAKLVDELAAKLKGSGKRLKKPEAK